MKRRKSMRQRRIDDVVADYNAVLLPGEPEMTRSEMVELTGFSVIDKRKDRRVKDND